jgi:TatD DNase family protein
MREHGVATIVVGTGLETSKKAVAFAEKESDSVLGATIGVHPSDTDESFDAATWKSDFQMHLEVGLPSEGRVVVGVGECGFDYYRTPREEVYKHQREIFEAQIDFAVEHNLPLMLHVRPSKGSDDAHEDALALLTEYQKTHGSRVRGNAHFFTGSLAIARRYWDMGFTVAFPGVITFAKETHEVVKEAPLNMILSETDAPYAAPEPYRGERNEPTYVIEVVKYIAQLRKADEEMVAHQLVENAMRIFGIRIK